MFDVIPISGHDEFLDAQMQASAQEDLIAVGRSAARRQKRESHMVDEVKKWESISSMRKKLEPCIQIIADDLPKDRTKWKDEHRVINIELMLMRCTDKPDVIQRAIEHIAKIKKLTVTGIEKGDDARKSKELEENMVKAAQTFQKALELRSRPAPEDPDA